MVTEYAAHAQAARALTMVAANVVSVIPMTAATIAE
jgi:hypothetical protein